MGVINRIIKKQPSAIKSLYYNIVPFRYRYGKVFSETCDFLDIVDNWSHDQALDHQFTELKRILLHSKKNVPYYGKLFAEYEFDVNIQSFEDMQKLPYLTKKIINDNIVDLQSKNHNGNKFVFKTSGSTGNRLTFFGDDSMFKKEAAYIHHSFKSHGSNLYDDWSVWIRRHSPKDVGDLIVKDYELKRIYISPFHLNDETVSFYVDTINKSKVKTIVTYPSTAYWLASLLEKHNLRLSNVKAIHGASEQCLDSWAAKIREVFGFSLKMHYGQVEKVSFMYQSDNSKMYHNDMTYSYTEYDEENVIVGTSFMNYVMPFIRYKTNDVITLNTNVIYDSSRPYEVLRIEGRVDDMIMSDNGSKIPSVNFYTVMSKREEVRMFQIYQCLDKSIIVKLVKNENFKTDVLKELEKELIKRVGKLPIRFEFVEEIRRDANTGKIRCVISEIK